MKTIEEAAIEFESNNGEKIYYDNINNCPDVKLCIESFKAGAEFAQRWISVKEELPESQGHYLVKCKTSFPKNCDVVVAEFYEDNNTFYSESGDHPIKDATHWRPIELK